MTLIINECLKKLKFYLKVSFQYQFNLTLTLSKNIFSLLNELNDIIRNMILSIKIRK